MNSLSRISSWMVLNWRAGVVVACAIGAAVTGRRCFETEQEKAERLKRHDDKQIRLVADRILAYAQQTHAEYPTGDVIVNERDLAEQLRKPQTSVAAALCLLSNQQKIRRASLYGYWKLNV